MKTNGHRKLPLQEQFELQARSRRRNPQRLLEDFMRECLQQWEQEKLFEEMSRQGKRSGYKESDAVRLVKEFRKAKRQARGKA